MSRGPIWCQCDEAYRVRHLIDPNCPHDMLEDVEALLKALDKELSHEVVHSEKVREAYNNVAAFIRPEGIEGCLVPSRRSTGGRGRER